MAGRIRIFAIKNSPALAMSATATEEDVKSLIKVLGLRDEPVVLKASPIQNHIKFCLIKRPPNINGMN